MNIANKLTVLRILLIPVMAALYFSGIGIGALAVFFVAAVTDVLDGNIARHYGMVTDLGKFLDPIADKMLNIAALLLVLWSCEGGSTQGLIIACCSIIIIFREIAITGFRIIAATKNVVIAADKWGKVKTVTQDVAVFLLLLCRLPFAAAATPYAIGLLCAATVLTVTSGINYLVKNRAVFSGATK